MRHWLPASLEFSSSMLPSRPRLEGWSPESLVSAGATVAAAGAAILDGVSKLATNIAAMADSEGWAGSAHDAANNMFGRASVSTTSYRDYLAAVGSSLANGAEAIGAARKALLDRADEVDQGPLNVSDSWVVLIDPGSQTAEEMAVLLAQAATEQSAINGLLIAVGNADSKAAESVLASAKPFGFEIPTTQGLPGLMVPGSQRPADDVPNPSDQIGLYQQHVILSEDMALTVRDVKAEIVNDDEYRRTLTMQDGSKHVIWEFGGPLVPKVTDTHYAPDGSKISSTMSWTNPIDGVHHLDIEWADGTLFNATETAEGVRTAAFTLPDGRHGVLPPDNPFFTGPVPTAAGGVLTALDSHVGRGGQLPGVSMTAAENIGKGAKFGGPAIGVLSTIYQMGVAETPYDRCVAGFSGGFGVVGDVLGGVGGGAAGTLTPPGAQAFTVPGLAVAGAAGGSYLFGKFGAKVGEAFC